MSIINFISLLHCEHDPWVKVLVYYAPHFILFCSLAIITPPACLSPCLVFLKFLSVSFAYNWYEGCLIKLTECHVEAHDEWLEEAWLTVFPNAFI